MNENGFREMLRPSFNMVYAPEFTAVHDQHPSIIQDVCKALESHHNPVLQEWIDEKKKKPTRTYFSIQIPNQDGTNQKFFIKQTTSEVSQGGISEFKAGYEASDLLKQKNVKGVRVVRYIFAYDDQIKRERYVVSEFNTVVSSRKMSDYLSLLYQKLSEAESSSSNVRMCNALREKERSIQKRLGEIFEVLGEKFVDITPKNMSYDEEKDEIILYDINYNTPAKKAFDDVSDDEL